MADPFLDVLHTLGRVPFGKGRVWPDYREWGAREEHVPALIGIIEDETYDWMDGELASTWAPLAASTSSTRCRTDSYAAGVTSPRAMPLWFVMTTTATPCSLSRRIASSAFGRSRTSLARPM